MNCFPVVLAAALVLPGHAWANAEVTVVVDMTSEGRAIVHPTPEHPAYYLPVMRGYHELGDVVAGEKPVSPHDVVRVVAPELVRQGYRVVNDNHREPDLVIDISWGYITKDDANARNQTQRYALVMGKTYINVAMPETVGHADFMEAANDPRYFVVVTAYDYAIWAKDHRKVILWKARMSLPTGGVFFGDVLEPLVKAGAPFFGRETVNFPKVVPAIPVGKVEVGTPTVRPEETAPPSSAGK